MKVPNKTLAFATALLALPMLAFSQNANSSQDTNGSQMGSPGPTGQREAMKMVRAQAELMHRLDAKKTMPGYTFKARLSKAAHLQDGTELPSGTILEGTVTQDDMQQQGKSKLALRFTQADLKDGKVIPLKATIVGIYKPQFDNEQDYPVTQGDQVPNSWTNGMLNIDQVGAMSGMDLHSKIASRNSGVLVSTKKDDVKLGQGTEFQLAIAPRS